MSSWKDIQSKLKRGKRVKLALGILAVVAGLLIMSWAIKLTQNLFSPWRLSVPSERSYIWNGQFNINLAIRTQHVALLSYNPKEEKIVIINIPDNTFLNVPGEFGSWQLRAVYELGESQKGTGGDKLLVETLTSFLGVPVDGFLDFSSLKPASPAGGSSKSAVDLLDTVRKNPFSGINLLSSLKTDLTLWELIRLKVGIAAVRFDKIKTVDLLKLDVLDRENLPDGTEIYTFDPVRVDSVLSDLADPGIVSEHKAVAVFNATDEPQLAGKWARLITNLGGNVIITANSQKRLQNTRLLGEESATLTRLRQIFGGDGKISPEDEDVASSRAQINLFLGEDYLNR